MESILTLAIPVVIGLLVVKLLLSQIGCLWKLAVNAVSGFICLWLLNLLSAWHAGVVSDLDAALEELYGDWALYLDE